MKQQTVSKMPLERGDERSPEIPAATPAAGAEAGGDTDRKRLRRLLFLIGPAVAVGIAAVVYFASGRYVDTDNAYVKADKVTISPQVAGPVLSVAVSENQQVRAGDELFRIDPQPYRIALERADAKLQLVAADIEGLKASYRQKQGQLRLAQSNVDFADREYARQLQLAKRKLTSQAKLDETQHALDTARDQQAVLQQELAQILSQLAGRADIPVEQHPRYLEAKANRDDAELDLQRTVVRAPFNGIASKTPQIGQYVAKGSAVMSVIAASDSWIEANFMETDLAHVRPGQPVTIKVDSYPGREWRGTVQSIAPATGAEFSVLPPQNASGNWVKVVQRIPVRIAVSAGRDDPPLRVGMTADVSIDTGAHHTLGALLHFGGAER